MFDTYRSTTVHIEAPVCQPQYDGSEPDSLEWTREERLAWLETEFAGIEPDRLVEDWAGETDEYGEPVEGIKVPEWQLQMDRSMLRELRRVWLNTYREGADGSRVVRGAHPFSRAEGAAEWLQRARIEMRQLYREAQNDKARAAIVAREAALRARHNARCFARCIATYYGLDEPEVLAVLDRRQKEEPIGWLGLEAALRHILVACEDDYFEAMRRWDAEFRASWTQEQKDEWLDRMPVRPEWPTQLVTSAKRVRKYEAKRESTAPAPTPFVVASAKRLSKLQRDQLRRASVAAALSGRVKVELPPKPSDEEVATWVEFARSEAVYEKQTVPESYPLDWQHGQMCEGRCCAPR